MLTQCPECKTLVDVGDEPPETGGRITCEQCGHEFAARFFLRGETTVEDTAGEVSPKARYRINVSPEEMLAQRPHGETVAEDAAPAPPGRMATGAWALGIALLVVALLGQSVYFMRDDLARHARLRPWMETLCDYAGCEIPLMRDPSRIDIVGRDIRRHPDAGDALIVTVTLRNQANAPQAYPWLELSFYDMAKRVIARRRFRPAEYLPDNIGVARGMRPGIPVQSTLEIVDPGQSAVNFEFGLL